MHVTIGEKPKKGRRLAKLREALAKAKREGQARPKVSGVLASIAEGPAEDAITVGELLAVLGRRAFGFALLLLGIVSVVPLPPGVSSLAGVLICFFGFQLLLGRRRPWVPGFLGRRTFSRRNFARVFTASERYITYAESFCWPRLPIVAWLVSPYVAGVVVVALSFYIMLPVIFAGVLPGIALVIIALALIEGDGLILLFGLATAGAALFVSTTLAAGTLYVGLSALTHLLGF